MNPIIDKAIKEIPIEGLHIRPYIWQQDGWMIHENPALYIIGGPYHGKKAKFRLDAGYRPGVLEIKDNDGGVIAAALVWLSGGS